MTLAISAANRSHLHTVASAGPPPAQPTAEANRPIRRTHSPATVAVMVMSPTAHLPQQFYFIVLFAGIREALAEHGLAMTVLTPKGYDPMSMEAAFPAAEHVDGAIIVGLRGNESLPTRFLERRAPAVIQGPTAWENLSNVDCDNRRGAQVATEHLISLGRRKVATIAGFLDLSPSVARLAGYRDAIVQSGRQLDPTLEEVGDHVAGRAHMAMERLLLNHPDIDAVFVASPEMAIAALEVLAIARRRVPEDVAVICYDDPAFVSEPTPPLSAMRQPIKEMGRQSVEIFLRE